MGREQRVVRPYIGVDRVQELLDTVRINFGERQLDPKSRLSVPENVYLAERMQVVLADSEDAHRSFCDELAEALGDMGLNPHDVSLMAVLSSTRLKLKEIVWRKTVAELHDSGPLVTVATAGERPRPLKAPFGGCYVDLYVALTTSLPQQPLRPSRRGTWLARTSYSVQTDLGEIGFTPIPLSDEDRDRLQLAPNTVRYIDLDSATNPEEVDSAGLSVYVDEAVLSQLASQPTTPGAESFQLQLFLDAMTTIVYTASREMRDDEVGSYSDASESLLGRLLTRICEEPNGDVDYDQAATLWNDVENQPARVVAIVEGWLPDFQKKLQESIGGES